MICCKNIVDVASLNKQKHYVYFCMLINTRLLDSKEQDTFTNTKTILGLSVFCQTY